ncbi:unnamed protein product [Periconia digitata]|uniref:Uncharacterized protein n=1 Tax=Periconia digitata TaxID=1303443 RepID=A0A9W4U6D0_9PLEO|nr:unnamed protein product [Periconia digitata]
MIGKDREALRGPASDRTNARTQYSPPYWDYRDHIDSFHPTGSTYKPSYATLPPRQPGIKNEPFGNDNLGATNFAEHITYGLTPSITGSPQGKMNRPTYKDSGTNMRIPKYRNAGTSMEVPSYEDAATDTSTPTYRNASTNTSEVDQSIPAISLSAKIQDLSARAQSMDLDTYLREIKWITGKLEKALLLKEMSEIQENINKLAGCRLFMEHAEFMEDMNTLSVRYQELVAYHKDAVQDSAGQKAADGMTR